MAVRPLIGLRISSRVTLPNLT